MKGLKFKWNKNNYLYKGGREFRILSEGLAGGCVFYVTDERIIDVLLDVVKGIK